MAKKFSGLEDLPDHWDHFLYQIQGGIEEGFIDEKEFRKTLFKEVTTSYNQSDFSLDAAQLELDNQDDFPGELIPRRQWLYQIIRENPLPKK